MKIVNAGAEFPAAAYTIGMSSNRTDRYPEDLSEMTRRIQVVGIAAYARELGGSTQALRRYLLRRGVDLVTVSTPGRIQKASYPATEVMLSHIDAKGVEDLAREIGVSGNAIRKELVRRGVTRPTRPYVHHVQGS